MVGSPKRREIGHGRCEWAAGARQSCRIWTNSRTPYVLCLKSLNPTVPLLWLPCAARFWR